MPINTDGGLIANGEPIVQVDPRVAYARVYGAPGTAGVTILSR